MTISRANLEKLFKEKPELLIGTIEKYIDYKKMEEIEMNAFKILNYQKTKNKSERKYYDRARKIQK